MVATLLRFGKLVMLTLWREVAPDDLLAAFLVSSTLKSVCGAGLRCSDKIIARRSKFLRPGVALIWYWKAGSSNFFYLHVSRTPKTW